MIRKLITRPVLATVISIILVILGIVGMFTLPITKFPDIAPPSVQVSTMYTGASADVIARTVAPPLEDAINGVEDMTYMTSTSSNDGTLTITVYFKLGTDPDQAAVNVQNRVSQATSQLPSEVTQYGVTTTKRQNSMVQLLNIYSENKEMDETFLQNYAKINVVPELKRVNGVGEAQVLGAKDYSMRIWLNPQQMAAYDMTPQEVMAAIQNQNIEAAPGRFGQRSGEAMEYVIRYKGKLFSPEDYESISIRANSDGSILRLKDVARIEFGSFTYAADSKYGDNPTCAIMIYQTAGSNANEIEININETMERLSEQFPQGVKYSRAYSAKESLDQSIEQVIHTLLEAFLLVSIVVFIFLQDWRSTLIPAIAVPVSIIGTFFFMQLFGFSINLLTLFALVLAIGIVVDDAIVVVEAVHAKMEHRNLPPKTATARTMTEITGALVSITLVMSAVFIPVAFMDGPTGVFYRQFALTLAIAIIISAVNALTLSPALCALFLKPPHDYVDEKGVKHIVPKKKFGQRFFDGFNAGFNSITNRYVKSLILLVKKQWIAFTILIAVIAGFLFYSKTTPTAFIPDEDQGFLIATVTLPSGASLERTSEVIDKGSKLIRSKDYIDNVVAVSGFNMLTSSTSSSSGVFMIEIKDIKDRGKVQDIDQIIGELQGMLSSTLKEANIFVLSFPTVPGFGTTSGVEMVLQDRTNGDIRKFEDLSKSFIGKLNSREEIGMAFTTFKADYPQYEMEVNNDKAKQLGVEVSDLMTVMQAYYGSMQASDFNRFGKYYRVMIQSEFDDRKDISSLTGIFVKNNLGEMVPVSSLINMKRVYGPETVDHFNLFNSISITVMPAPGFSTGQVLAAIDEVSAQDLPTGFTKDYKGMTREEQGSGSTTTIIFVLCIVFVYLLLAGQYESYIIPFSVILSIPTGLLGVFIGINLAGLSNNIYVQVAMIMLLGLLAKNAILIVEYALQRRKAGKTLAASAIEGAKSRLRPIIMTSFAFIAGLLPLLFVEGSSAIGNHSIGWSAVMGMFFGISSVFLTPIFFVFFTRIHEKLKGPLSDEELDLDVDSYEKFIQKN